MRRGVVVGALAVALTACGGGGGTAPEREPLPLGADWYDLGVEFSHDDIFAEAQEVENLVAACMAGHGFDYVPMDASQVVTIIPPVDDDVEWGTRGFAERYGYGATTDPWAYPVDDGSGWSDPNADYVHAMSASERLAYDTALNGDPTRHEGRTDEDVAAEAWDWRDAGCYGRAQHEVHGDVMGSPESEFGPMFADRDAMRAAAAADPRVAEAVGAWAACMAEAGHPGLTDLRDAEDLVHLRAQALWDEAYDGAWDTPGAHAGAEATYQELRAGLQPWEIAVATADWDCREDVGYLDVRYEVDLEYQLEFVEIYRAELAAYALTRP